MTAKRIGRAISRSAPAILTACAVGGLATTAILSARAAPRAAALLEEARKQAEGGELKPLDAAKAVWKCYVPAGAVGLASAACIIGAHRSHVRRSAALMAVYSMTETAFKEYRAKVTDAMGLAKERRLREEISAERLNSAPAVEIVATGNGRHLCYERWNGRYFRSDIERVRRAVNDLNRELISETQVTLNDFYYALGLPNTESGDLLGWAWDIGDESLEIEFTSDLDANGEPCLVLTYNVKPIFVVG